MDSLIAYANTIPVWLKGFVVVISALALAVIVYSLFSVSRLRSMVDELVRALQKMGEADDGSRAAGRTLAEVDVWRDAAQRLSGPAKSISERIDRRLVTVTDREGGRRFKLRDSETEVLDEDSVLSQVVNIRFIDATPSLLTALGLIGTFVAIALALAGLQTDAVTERIRGVDGLINGLSGKFITSIFALVWAFVVQAIDALYLRRRLRAHFERLLAGIDNAFPTLSPAQQIAELLESSHKQERSLANISSDVVDRFSDVFSTDLLPQLGSLLAGSVQVELGPALARVADGIATLEEGIRRLETGKQESIGSELRQLTTSLEQSLRGALEEMGEKFREALSGSAGQEFENASGALRASADVLQGMNSSFEAMQASMERLLAESEQRAQRSFDEGEGRTRALNELVERLVGQLNESASTSASEVQRLLVQSVTGMSSKLAEFTSEIEERVRSASAESMRTNQQLLSEVTGAAGRTSSETERLLSRIGERAEDFVQSADQLRELREGVQGILAQTGEKVRELHGAAESFRSVATEAATLTRALKEAQELQRRSSEASSVTASRLEGVMEQQARVTQATNGTFEQAGSVLETLDSRLSSALGVLLSQMQNYNTQVEKNFEVILTKVNERIPELFERLEASLQSVAESVEELQESVDSINKQRR